MKHISPLAVTVTVNPCIDTVMFVDKLVVGDVNRVARTERDAGGKGINLSRVVHKLGGATIASGLLGGGTGAHVASILDSEKVPHDFVHIAGETRTNFFVESAEGTTCLDAIGPQINDSETEALIEEVRILCHGAKWLAIGGAIPDGVRPDIFCVLSEIGHAARAKVLLDADGDALRQGMKAGPDLVKPNIREAERLLGREICDTDQAIAAAIQIREQLLHDQQRAGYDPIVLISRGLKGAAMAADGRAFVGNAPPVRKLSTVGSGDSMLAAFIWALEQGKPIEDCLRWGLAAGAATAMTSGSEIASVAQVLALLPKAGVLSYPAREACLNHRR